jgi:hypothetical protein
MDPFSLRTDGALDPIVLAGFALGLVGLVAGWRRKHRLRRAPLAGAFEHVYQVDLADALRIWGGAQVFAGLAWILRFDRFSMPFWSDIVLLLGTAAALIAWWRGDHADWTRSASPSAMEAKPRAESETWQYGLLVAAIGAFAGYSLGIVLGFMGPIHLLLALFVGTANYPAGLVLFSPRPVLFRSRTPVPD